MRVAISAVAGTLGGPATYAARLVRALVDTYPDDEFVVVTDRPAAFAEFTETVDVPLGSKWRQPLWDHWSVPRALRGQQFDVFHGTKGVLPVLPTAPAVVTIHDLAANSLPETFHPAQRLHLALETRSALARAAAVITVSENSARDIRGQLRRPADLVTVVYNGPGQDLHRPSDESISAWRRKNDLEEPDRDHLCVGYLGTIQPRKNLDLLADAFEQAAAGRPWTLLVAGRIRPGYRPDCLGPERLRSGRIRYLGAIGDDEVSLFLSSLRCMVSPSAYEGFGLTFVEAMQVGCPVVALSNSAVPEVVGDAGLLVDGERTEDLARAICRVAEEDRLAMDLSERGRARATRFSWYRAARETHAVYARVAAAGGVTPSALLVDPTPAGAVGAAT